MSLIRQIWLLLMGTVLFAFVGSITVNFNTSADTLQTQLQLKNSDNATSLALALSQQKGDAELMSLLVSAQFDTGFYKQIKLLRSDGKVLFERHVDVAPLKAPPWFVHAFPIESRPGVAQVSNGWRAMGSVHVVSQTAFVHDNLWRSTLQSALALALVGVLAGLIGTFFVASIRRPLEQTVKQAQSLVAGQFITVSEPRIPELKRFTHAMNTMVFRLKLIFEAQSQQVETLRQQAHCDALTGLAHRKHFMAQLNATLHGEHGVTDGGLVLLRVLDLAGLNRDIGHINTDKVVVAVAHALKAQAAKYAGSQLGRLNGSDFAVCIPVNLAALESAQKICDALRDVLPSFGDQVGIVVSAVEIHRGHTVGQIMGSADLALARAESRGAFAVELGEAKASTFLRGGEGAWREKIQEAIFEDRAHLVSYPVIDSHHQLIHRECNLRLQMESDGPFDTAARWLPLALRSRLTGLLDERALSMTLAAIAKDDSPRCVNLAAASLYQGSFISKLREMVSRVDTSVAKKLWIEVPEAGVIEHMALLKDLTRQLRPLGVRVGIEHAGERLTQMQHLFEVGIDYVKLDSAVVQGVGEDKNRENFIKGLITLLHGLSIKAYAEGVSNPEDVTKLWSLGVDGLTGPWASVLRTDLVDVPRLT